MALQLGALRDALGAAGVDRDLARKAAEEVATYQADFATLRADIAALRSEMKAEFAVVHGRINLLGWMVTFNLALTVLVLGKLFGVIGGP